MMGMMGMGVQMHQINSIQQPSPGPWHLSHISGEVRLQLLHQRWQQQQDPAVESCGLRT